MRITSVLRDQYPAFSFKSSFVQTGAAGINFEHTGVDGHTVLRFAADVFTDGLMLLARSINPSAPTLFRAKLSPYAKSYKPPRGHQQ
jgi:carnitine O-acetyltransferase